MPVQTLITFTVPIVPKGQMRAKHARVGGFTRAYKDPRQAAEEQTLLSHLVRFQPERPFEGQLLLGVRAYLPIPASKPKKWKAAALAGGIRPTCKPDMDNLLKHVKDCLTMQRFWPDDRFVVGYLAGTGKYYSDRPRWEIAIAALTPAASATPLTPPTPPTPSDALEQGVMNLWAR